MNQISEGKLIALRRLERVLFASIFRGILRNNDKEKFADYIKTLEEYCYEEFSKHNNAHSIMRRLDKLMSNIHALFCPKGQPSVDKFNTKQYAIIALLLFEQLQEDFDIGQEDNRVVTVVGSIFEMFNQNQDQWNNEKYLKAQEKRSRKLLRFLNDNELFIYKDVRYV